MKAVQLSAYNRNVLRALLSLSVIEKATPKIHKDEVLVKMHASSCNPSDIAFIQGGYNIIKSLPTVPGFEGSGVVVETGSDVKELIDKKVSCFIQDNIDGTWAEYFRVKKENLIVLEEKMNLDQAACFSVNPFTAYALLLIAEKRNSKSIIQNAAGGQVAELVRQLSKFRNLETINIVRKKETAERLKTEGIKYVLCEQDKDFPITLKNLATELNACIAFDAVGGPSSGTIIDAMPHDSELIVYGGLSNKPISDINTMEIIFKNKVISGFNLLDWKNNVGNHDYMKIANKLQKMFIDEKLKTNVQGSINMENIIQGLKTYLGNMSKGKILIKP